MELPARLPPADKRVLVRLPKIKNSSPTSHLIVVNEPFLSQFLWAVHGGDLRKGESKSHPKAAQDGRPRIAANEIG
jgi:hypothetical protein